MNRAHTKPRRVLALSPSTRGFGYAVFEELLLPVDWGVKHVRGDKSLETLRKLRALIDWYQPDVVLLEDAAAAASRRHRRIKRLIDAMAEVGQRRRIEIRRFSRAMIRTCFRPLGATTKYEIARTIARQLPELESRLPAPRKIWMSEDPRMGIFDAASLIFTFFYVEELRDTPAS